MRLGLLSIFRRLSCLFLRGHDWKYDGDKVWFRGRSCLRCGKRQRVALANDPPIEIAMSVDGRVLWREQYGLSRLHRAGDGFVKESTSYTVVIQHYDRELNVIFTLLRVGLCWLPGPTYQQRELKGEVMPDEEAGKALREFRLNTLRMGLSRFFMERCSLASCLPLVLGYGNLWRVFEIAHG